jgi:hypothetical protein
LIWRGTSWEWSVAWSFRKRTDHLKRAQTGTEMKRVVFTTPAVVNYEVRAVTDQRLGKGKRTIARIHAKWAVEQLGQLHKEAILTVDQNLNPVARRVMTRGQRAHQRQDLDTRNSVRGIGLLPFYLPKLAKEPGTAARLPGVPSEMSKFRPVEKAGTSALELDVKFNRQVRAQTFWVKGDLYAAIVSGPDVHGVLVKQSKAR